MYGRSLKNTGKKIIPKALYLHIFITDKSQVYHHIRSDKQLRYMSCILVFSDKEKQPQRNRYPYVTEIEEVKQIVRDIMENTFQLDVPLKVDIETGTNWYEAK